MPSPRAGQSVDEILSTFRKWSEQVDELRQMIPLGGYLVRGAGEPAQAAARALKEAVRLEYRRPAAIRRAHSDVERDFFEPCVHRVFVALQKLRIGTSPRAEWRHALDDAAAELSHATSQLGFAQKRHRT